MTLREIIAMVVGASPRENPWGIVAEFEGPGQLLAAARALRQAGYRRYDAHTPFPVHGMNEAMGLRPSRVPLVALAGGVTGAALGLAMQWWINAVDYPLVISDKPILSWPAFIPVTFELTILLAAFGAVGSMFLFNFLPMLYHPLLKHERFGRVTDDGFMLSVEARDPRFEPQATRELLASLGGDHITLLEP